MAEPGTLTLSEVPLAPGRRVRLEVERPLREPFVLERATARLVLSEAFWIGSSAIWRPRYTLELSPAGIQVLGRTLRAAWDVDLPAEATPPRHHSPGFLTSPHHFRWELRLTTPTPDVRGLDCCFHIPFAFAPEEAG